MVEHLDVWHGTVQNLAHLMPDSQKNETKKTNKQTQKWQTCSVIMG